MADTGTGAKGARAAQEALSRRDLIVVGVGAVGSAALRAASESGANVLGIELHAPAHARGSSHGLSRIFRHAYFEHPDYVPLLRHSTARFESLEIESGARLLHRCGMLVMGDSGSETVSGSLASARRWNLPVEGLDATALRSRFPWFAVADDAIGAFEANAGIVRPEATVHAAVAVARARGAELRVGSRVRSIVEDDDRRDGGDRRGAGAGSGGHRGGRRVDVAADAGTRAAADRDATGAGLVCPDRGHRRLGDALLAVRSRTRPARDLRPGARSAGGRRRGRRAVARPLSQGRAARVRRRRRSGHRRASGRRRPTSQGSGKHSASARRRWPATWSRRPPACTRCRQTRTSWSGRAAHARARISLPDSRATASSSRPRSAMRSSDLALHGRTDLPVGFLAPDRFGTRG